MAIPHGDLGRYRRGNDDGANRPMPDGPLFYSVAQTAELTGLSAMTIYRAIADGEFPAVQIRGRLVIPAKAIEAMADAAMAQQTVVGATGWVVRR
jgi:excisionase family DNA binding protein